MKKIPSPLDALSKPTWLPKVENRQTTSLESKYAGVPWLAAPSDWPLCGICKKNRMRFVLQLEIDQLPPEMKKPFKKGGLIQFFYSTDGCFPDPDENGAIDLTPISFIRVVQPPAKTVPVIDTRFLSKLDQAIVGWKETRDYPDTQEYEELGYPDLMEQLDSLTGAERTASMLKERAISGDKLGGWESWTQGVERKACPECKKPMSLLYQLNMSDSSEEPSFSPNLFASDGTGHLVFCREHPDRFYFSWACG